MVTVYIGLRSFTVHEELICNKIDYFNKLFKGNFEEATTKTVTLKEDDPDTFAHVINWLYGEAFVCKKDSCKAPVTVASDPGHILPSVALYVLADKYGIVELAQQCIHVCDTCLVGLGNALTEEEVTVIYEAAISFLLISVSILKPQVTTKPITIISKPYKAYYIKIEGNERFSESIISMLYSLH